MKCDMKSFDAIQEVKRFVTNGVAIPFLYRIDTTELRVGRTGPHIIRVIDKEKNSMIKIELSDLEAVHVFNRANPIPYIARLLNVLLAKVDDLEGGEKRMALKTKTVSVFDDKYFIIGHAYRMTINPNNENIPEKFRGETIDCIVENFDRYCHMMTVIWISDNTIRRFEISVDDFEQKLVAFTRLIPEDK